MRVLFSVRPYLGHFHPLTELARQLRDDGDDVLFATAASLAPIVRADGFAAREAGLDPAAPAAPPQFGLEATAAKLDDLLELAASWRPDVIIRDPTDFAALLAAELIRAPAVTFGFSLYIEPWQWRELVGSALEGLRDRHGLVPDPQLMRLHPDLYLDCVPPWFRSSSAPPAAVTESIRPVPTVSPGPAPRDEAPPIVYMTMGTVYNRDRELFRLLASAFAAEPVRLVVTVGPDQDPADVLPDPPANVSAASYIPQAEILPRAALVVCHGGFNTVIGALAHGLPVLSIPAGSDQHANAERCRALGVGITLTRSELTVARARQALRRALDDHRLAAAGARLRALIAELPGPPYAAARVRSVLRTA